MTQKDLMTGTVVSYCGARGFGFIECPPYERIYFHATTVAGRVGVPVGARVTFFLVNGNKGPQAASVRMVTLSPAEVLKSKTGA